MSDFVDPYVDAANGIPRNLVGATTQEHLDQVEADIVEARTVDLPKQRLNRPVT